MKRVLWTGGWDSTFRVLDLVLNKKEEVQPYYVLDNARKSTKLEIKTMNKIKLMVMNKDSEAGSLLKNQMFIEKDKIPKNNSISKDFQHLLTLSFLGSQYDWLARYVDYVNFDTLELCIHKDDKAEGFIRGDVTIVEEGNDSFYTLVDKPTIPQLRIFSHFNFPLLDMTKLEMAEFAKKRGFSDIMEETWFCYNPLKDGKPCGICNPCKYTREEGLGRRVPDPTPSRRIQVFLLKVKHRLTVSPNF